MFVSWVVNRFLFFHENRSGFPGDWVCHIPWLVRPPEAQGIALGIPCVLTVAN